jgi:predicted transcriptional regulator
MGLVETRLTSLLAEKGIEITVCIPETPVLSFRSLGDALDLLDGDILCGEDGLERSFGAMTVGSAELQGELSVLKRLYNKVVLLGPSPLTEEPSTQRTVCGVLLTGGREPPRQIIDAARSARIPLMLTKADAFEVRDRLERNPPTLTPKEEEKVKHFTSLMNRDGALERLVDSLAPA